MQALAITNYVSDDSICSSSDTKPVPKATRRPMRWDNFDGDEFTREFSGITKANEIVASKRDHYDSEANPDKAATFNPENFQQLHGAERDHREHTAETNEPREIPQMNPTEEGRSLDSQVKEHERYQEEISALKRQTKSDKDSILYLKDQHSQRDLNAMRSIVRMRREAADNTGHIMALQWETARLTSDNRELRALNDFLQRQVESFEHDPAFFNPAWEDPNAEGIVNADAARRLVRDVLTKFAGRSSSLAIYILCWKATLTSLGLKF